MRKTSFVCFLATAAIVLAVGCHKKKPTVDTAGFRDALNTYFQSHPICAWDSPQQFPVDLSAAKPDPVEQQQLDALASAGLLVKKTTEKELPEEHHHRRHREKVTEYDLTDQGKSAASSALSQGGGANFCVGTPTVSSIDSYAAAPDTSHYSVSFHFSVGNLPGWASADPVKAAFPKIAAVSTGKPLTALAKLTRTNNGWTASGVQPVLIPPTS